MEKDKSKILTIKEFSEAIKTTHSTVRRWCINKEIKATKRGRKWLIPKSELEKIINPPD